ncbi:melatonin receptor type 1A-like [Oculina patagonica]
MDVSQVVLLSLSTCVILLGVCGNLLVLLGAYREKSLRKVPYMLVLNLCVCHLVVLLVPYMVFVLALSKGEWKFSASVCKCQAYMAYTLTMEIIATMVLISINRYIRVVHPVKYPFIFTQRSTAFLITSTWLVSALGNIFPLIGYGKYGFNNPGDYMCALQVSESVIQITIGGVSIIIAAIIIITCYVRVFCTIRSHKQRVRPLNRTTSDGHRSSFSTAPRESRGEEIQIAITLFLLVVIFGICWSPTVVSVVINAITEEPTSHLAGLIRVNALVLETVADPIVYAIRNKKFRKVLRKTFTCKKRS